MCPTLYVVGGRLQALAAPNRRMTAEKFPERTPPLRVPIQTETGSAILQCCPSNQAYDIAAARPEFASAAARVGTPPRIEPLGNVGWLRAADIASPA
jgi:hypothetical protein